MVAYGLSGAAGDSGPTPISQGRRAWGLVQETELLQAVRKSAAQSDVGTACWARSQRACTAENRLKMLCSTMGASRLPVMA